MADSDQLMMTVVAAVESTQVPGWLRGPLGCCWPRTAWSHWELSPHASSASRNLTIWTIWTVLDVSAPDEKVEGLVDYMVRGGSRPLGRMKDLEITSS